MSRVSLVEDIAERRENALANVEARLKSGLNSYKNRAGLVSTAQLTPVRRPEVERAFRVMMPRKQTRYFDNSSDALRFATGCVQSLPTTATVHVLNCKTNKIVFTLRGCIARKVRKVVRRKRVKSASR